MARVEPEELRDPEQIFVAGSLRVARPAEEWLATAGVDYAVQVEELGRSILFGPVRMGAAFHVSSTQPAHCRQQLTAAGLGAGVVEVEE